MKYSVQFSRDDCRWSYGIFYNLVLYKEESMKRIKKRLKSKNLIINTSPKIKMSELIGEYASDYINMGENTEERQNYLNGACTA